MNIASKQYKITPAVLTQLFVLVSCEHRTRVSWSLQQKLIKALVTKVGLSLLLSHCTSRKVSTFGRIENKCSISRYSSSYRCSSQFLHTSYTSVEHSRLVGTAFTCMSFDATQSLIRPSAQFFRIFEIALCIHRMAHVLPVIYNIGVVIAFSVKFVNLAENHAALTKGHVVHCIQTFVGSHFTLRDQQLTGGSFSPGSHSDLYRVTEVRCF